ncbi:LysR substrate-binding domain-containing protein [Mesorhizobium sp. SP-1A]|uniref:LysR substrate-binding domain-containing protein n=1 Tax=Mesorhizobium sp. SP-1A TaxID=3077840 RepID=UPI0028F7207C|nr:LysR substrate-binding domain-containing protein [Mesorhizobium sp. SP-1A]
MNSTPLELDLLRAFVTVVDSGGFTAAARRLHSTQSTVSQKVLRLEGAAGHRLLQRERGGVRPTEAGERLLGYARRILALDAEAAAALSGMPSIAVLRLGLPEDFAAGRCTGMLAAFARGHPGLKLEVASGLSRDLMRLYERGELDLALVKQRRDTAEGVERWPEPLCWIDSLDHPTIDEDPLPLVVFPSNGLYRDDMIDRLDALGRRWRIAYSCPSLAGIQSAVADGLGISLLPRRTTLPRHRILDEADGFAAVETMEIAVHHRSDADILVLDLARRLAELVEASGKG